MGGPAKTIYVGLDGCDLDVARRFAAEGDMPNLAALLDESAVAETLGPVGHWVAANWPTIYTGTTPTRHRFLCAGQIAGGTYEWRWTGQVTTPPAIWEHLSGAGMRVASLDAPHAYAVPGLNGVQVVEWGCHDRHARPASYPAPFLEEVNSTYGAHPVGTLSHEQPHFAPCDYAHRAGPSRTVEEDAALFADLLEADRRKRAMSLDLLDRGGWDLFFTVLGETHCAGHQFWKYYDTSHPWHDPAALAALGTEPLRAVYAAVDKTLGEHLARADRDTTVFLHMDHGMRAHYDGTHVLDPVLWRLDQYVSGARPRGPLSRIADAVAGVASPSARQRAFSAAANARARLANRAPLGFFDEELPWIGRRRWWAQPNDTVCGSVRLNLEGREPLGRIKAARAREVLEWLGARLLELVNLDTGRPAVKEVLFTDDHYERVPGDAFGDLIVEWERSAQIETVWSPATGVVRVPYRGWRSGDHQPRGLLCVRGPGLTPGPRETVWNVDVAPTVAATLDHEMRDVDGIVRTDLLPSRSRSFTMSFTRPALATTPTPTRPTRRRWPVDAEITIEDWAERAVLGLSSAHHVTAERVQYLETRVENLDQLAAITEMTAWLRQIDVPESLLVSVVMPTHNRPALLERAIASVQAQTYSCWELLVVDDGSTDDTWSFLEKVAASDERIRPFRFEQNAGVSAAMNHALEHAQGDVIAFLDDDNRFDVDWLRAVAWAFQEHPDDDVLYGARVVDDDDRHRGLPTRSKPFVQFLRWDRDAELVANRVDQNVIAHRRSAVRFDESLSLHKDWDYLLQLTDEKDPLPLPVIAVYYYSDVPGRLSDDPDRENTVYEYVRAKAIARRSARRL